MRLRFVQKHVLQNHPEVIIRAIQKKASIYTELPIPGYDHEILQPSRLDVALPACLAKDTTPKILERAATKCPELLQNRRAVLAICEKGTLERIRTSVPPKFSNDLQIVLAAVRRNPSLVSLASTRLRQHPEVILETVQEQNAITTLSTVPWSTQQQYPQITIRCIQLCKASNLQMLPIHIPADAWRNRDVVKMWIQRGGRVLEAFDHMVVNDRELALLLVEHNLSEAVLRLSGQGLDGSLWHAVARSGLCFGRPSSERGFAGISSHAISRGYRLHHPSGSANAVCHRAELPTARRRARHHG